MQKPSTYKTGKITCKSIIYLSVKLSFRSYDWNRTSIFPCEDDLSIGLHSISPKESRIPVSSSYFSRVHLMRIVLFEERKRFELPDLLRSFGFKANTLGHSVTSPCENCKTPIIYDPSGSHRLPCFMFKLYSSLGSDQEP